MKRIALSVVALVMALSFTAASVYATPAKAKATGKKCSECHNDQTVKPRGPHSK